MRENENWRTGGVWKGRVYLVGKEDLGRVGNCWMAGRLLEGDLVTPLKLEGDSFWKYQLLEGHRNPILDAQKNRLFRRCEGAVFGAYALGELYEGQPTETEWHRMMADVYTTFTGTR